MLDDVMGLATNQPAFSSVFWDSKVVSDSLTLGFISPERPLFAINPIKGKGFCPLLRYLI